ncbi:tartrate-resistant acid phosphatase type 5 [Strongylocentrotus purpuratus]|uniref:Tartrate-resistant acid phosphatase type 5 n=1 Tax=Strongylocentrotus purpuratus TaxID=7668 RepID=A0A7M7PMU7_STRPU|nr:tartrate-resistant acid phosphatase type 5 [Strongylocentrotus purpuratus]|eukprot:XP_796862.1 PREDICTED: tartrate-resistant acid phosphatase type 5 [Strongylocentrotus purpuratus]
MKFSSSSSRHPRRRSQSNVGAAMFSWIFTACFLLHICHGCAPYFSQDESVEEGTEEIPEPARPAEAALRRAPVTKPPQWYADPVGSEVRFLVLGDIGGLGEPPYTTDDQEDVAWAAGKVADNFKADFIVELGDNFYENGVKDVHDPRFRQTFEDVYTAESLQVPWYIVPGNHDWDGNITAQIEYSKISERWHFPSLYYTKEFRISDSPDAKLFMVVIDTMLLCGMGTPPTGPWNVSAAEDQWIWLEHQLNATKEANYVIVAGHYPVRSMGSHGPTRCLVERLEPLLKQYNVSAYFAGHDHNLQHIHEPGSPVEYFISGAGSKIDPGRTYRFSVPPEWQHFHMGNIQRKGGFLYAEATAERLTVAFTDAKDVWDFHTTTISPRRIR